MPLARVFSRLSERTRRLSVTTRAAGTVATVAAAFGLRWAVDGVWPSGYPFLLAFLGILAAASLFGETAGLAAVGISAVLAAWFYMAPGGSLMVGTLADAVALGAFVGIGSLLCLVIETLHRSIEQLSLEKHQHARTIAELQTEEARRGLILREFRHRTRNDLQSLVGLLRLRARGADDHCRAQLQAAAHHALSLARVHARLAALSPDAHHMEPVIGSGEFVAGLAEDIARAQFGDGLRPIAMLTSTEDHPIDTERAVALGTVLNECLMNAMRHAYPGDRGGRICVRFRRVGDDFVLEIEDDGIGMACRFAVACSEAEACGRTEDRSGGLGSRILNGLAAQLRGSFSRGPAPSGGTLCRLAFPAAMPQRLPPAAPLA